VRLAVLPITSFRHLKGESEIVMFTAQIKQWVHDHEDTWVYLILPEECQEQGWEGIVEGWPRCTVLWIDKLGLYYDKLTDLPGTFLDTFNLRIGRYQIDGLVTSRRALTIGAAREMWDHRMKTSLPVFIDESMVVARNLTPSQVSEIEMMAQTLGYAYGYPVWDTETQKKNAITAARQYLSGAMTLRAIQKGVVIPCGFDPDRTDAVLARQNTVKEERFTCFFGGRLNKGSKRADIMLREYDDFFRFGRDIDITVCSPKDEGWILDMIKKDYPEINVLVQTPSDEFKARAARAHVFLNTSAHEGFSVGFAEMMYLTKYGTVLIAPRTHWTKGMFQDRFDDYPFLYNNFEEARIMLRWVHENYEAAVDKIAWLGDWVREQYDMKVTNEQHWQHYKTVTDRELGHEYVRGLMSDSNRELTLEALAVVPEEFSIERLYRQMTEMSRAMKEDPRRGQTTKWAVRRWLMNEGYAVDLYNSAETVMRKVTSDEVSGDSAAARVVPELAAGEQGGST
jgi:hypothetical protein